MDVDEFFVFAKAERLLQHFVTMIEKEVEYG